MRHEDAILRAVIRWADDAAFFWPELRLLYHIPNEGKRTARQGARMKREGLRPGVPDLHLPVARGGFHGLWIELKAPGGWPTTNQLNWLSALEREGHLAVIRYSAESAIKEIENYVKKGEGK